MIANLHTGGAPHNMKKLPLQYLPCIIVYSQKKKKKNLPTYPPTLHYVVYVSDDLFHKLI